MMETEISTSMNKSYSTITPMEANLAYGTHGDMDTSSHHLPNVHQQQDMELTENQAYIATPNIPVEPNQCYVTTTLSVDPDQLYATVKGEHDITRTSQQTTAEEYEYVIP